MDWLLQHKIEVSASVDVLNMAFMTLLERATEVGEETSV